MSTGAPPKTTSSKPTAMERLSSITTMMGTKTRWSSTAPRWSAIKREETPWSLSIVTTTGASSTSPPTRGCEKTVRPRGSNDLCRYMGADVFCGPIGLQGQPDVLYHNNGDGTFTDVTEKAGIRDPNYYGFGVLFSDFDNDGWPDIYVANDSQPNLLFHNQKDGTFAEIGVVSGSALNEAGRAQSGMGVA